MPDATWDLLLLSVVFIRETMTQNALNNASNINIFPTRLCLIITKKYSEKHDRTNSFEVGISSKRKSHI